MIGTLCATLSVLLFSSVTLVSRVGYSSSLTLPDILALRFGIGGALLLPMLLRYGLAGVQWRDALRLCFLGGLGFALLAYSGFALAPAAHGAVVLHGTLSLTTFMLTPASQRVVSRMALVGFALIGVGIALIAVSSVTGLPRQLLGDGLLLLASFCWSAYGIQARRMDRPPAQTAAIVAVFSMCCFLPVYVCLPGTHLFQADVPVVLTQAVVQGVLIGAVSIFVYTRAVAGIGPFRTAIFTAAVPCVTILAAMPLLAEFPTVAEWMGVFVVTSGMIAGVVSPTDHRAAGIALR